MTTLFCPTCGTNTSFESLPHIGTLACTSCGTVSTASDSQSFEFLARVDEEDDYQGGRQYVGARGLRRDGRAENWARGAGEATRVYHQKKKGDFDAFVRRLLGRFDLMSIKDRVYNMCDNAKRLIQFRWGRRAEIFAAACVYVAAREQNRNLWLFDVADAIDIKDIYTLTRAIRIVKFELQINTPETEPALYLERILTHLNVIFSQPKPVLHGSSTKSKKTWSASNIQWVRALSLPKVRDLATGLLSFADSLSLAAGRSPEQVASACVLVALEGVARRPAPVGQDFCDELAHLLGGKAFTIQERYREFMKLLADYAPQLPYLANEEFAIPGEKVKAFKKGMKGHGTTKAIKKDLVQHTEDIVLHRQAIDARKVKAKREAEEAAAMADKGKGRAVDDDGFDEQGMSPFAGNVVFEEEEEGEGNEAEEDGEDPTNHLLYDDPLASVNASNAYLDDASFALPLQRAQARPEKVPPLGDAPRARPLRDEGKKRPAEYTRHGDKPNKRLKVIEDIAGRLATEASGSAARSPSPAPESRLSPALSLSPPAPTLPTLTYRPAHDEENRRIRKLLLAGHDPATIYAHLHTPSSVEARAIPEPLKPATRLGRLLWDKPADQVADEELFDDNELDSYIRPKNEVDQFLRLPQTQEMLRVAEEQEIARAGRPPRRPANRKRRRFFAKYYPQHDGPPPDAAEHELKVAGADGTTKRGEREDTTESTDSFAPRKRKTKLKPEARARIEALLAMEGIGDEDDDGDFGRGSGGGSGGKDDSPAVGQDEWRMEFALDAARDEGEGLHDDDGGDDAPSPASGTGGGGGGQEEDEEDWRAALGYGAQQEDEEGGYDD